MESKTYETKTKHGILKMDRDYKERVASGQIGHITFNIQFNDDEMFNILKAENIGVFNKALVENAMYKRVTGNEREVPQATPSIDIKDHVAVIKKALDSGSVTSENFEERLVAYADKVKLTAEQTTALRKKFPVETPTATADEISF